jgi:hypothetical protein
VTVDFFRVTLLTPRITLNLKDQGLTLRLTPTVVLVWHVWPYQELTLPPAYHNLYYLITQITSKSLHNYHYKITSSLHWTLYI